jgi:DNA-binding transcriptional MocR family regulator
LTEAQERGVGYRAGPLFSTEGDLKNCLRLSFTYYDDAALQEGATRLAQVIKARL